MSMSSNPVQLYGITSEDIIKMLEQTAKDLIKPNTMFGLDVSYLYTFDKNEIPKKCSGIDFHRNLERWYTDQTVRNDFGREIKPTQIVRQFDKIVNEGLEMLAGCIIGQEASQFKFHALGDADDLTVALSSDTQMGNEISRIDVTETTEGGSLSRDGSTIYIIGNHPASIASTDITETGVFDSLTTTNDKMLDHSVFASGVDHDQDENAPGATLVIYMCGL